MGNSRVVQTRDGVGKTVRLAAVAWILGSGLWGVCAAEPAWADDAARSLAEGSIQMPTRYDSIADGLRSPLGELNCGIIKQLVDDILLVSELEIMQTTRWLAETAKLVVEPSGAVATAAAIANSDKFSGQRVCCIISGGNIDFGSCKLGS